MAVRVSVDRNNEGSIGPCARFTALDIVFWTPTRG